MFGAGTAAVICPVASIGYQDDLFEVPGASPGVLTRRLYEEITGIQTGRLPDRHHWNLRVALPA
ncbi:MAG: branched-chain amino acid aminotransferase [Gammaproteobacteria bacterium]